MLPAALHAQNDFEAFKRRESERLRSFLTKEDAEFSDFLKQDWKEFALVVADKPLVRPKPRATPVARPVPVDAVAVPPSAPAPAAAPPPVLPGGAVPAASTLPSRRPVSPPSAPTPVELAGSSGAINTTFFGGLVSVPPPRVTFDLRPVADPITGEAIGAFWEQINAAPYGDVLAALQRQRALMHLGDWGFAQLAFRTGLTLTGGDTTLARLVAWHFLVKSGYAARVGFSGSSVHVLLKSDELLYGVSYFTIAGGKFYVLDLASGPAPNTGAIRTYERDHPEAKRSVTFSMTELPLFPDDLETRTLRFAYKGQRFEISTGVNRNLVRFLSQYPQTQLAGYLNADAPSSALESLVAGLRPIIAGRSELESVDLVLRFVQTAFEYKTDGDQFSREKWMFPEETLFYPYSDCEDRSILFSYLVRKLVPSVSVIGLIYSDHVATAVRFNSDVSGDARTHRGVRYVVSDPTYINASVGMEMSQYKASSPNVVEARALSPR